MPLKESPGIFRLSRCADSARDRAPKGVCDVMKSFACGDVVPGCDARWVCATENELLANVADHARRDHGMVEIPNELVDQVRARILTVA